MKTKTKLLLSLVLLIIVPLVSGCGFRTKTGKQYSLKLEVWGLFDDRDAFNDIFENYRKINPNIADIVYKKLTPDTYKKELLEALASGKGPDIFLVHNTWVPSFSDKITPAPGELLTEQKFRRDFVDVVADDFLSEGKIYGVPLSVDSLGLYYNKDLFNEAGITMPPKNWDEFVSAVQKLTKISPDGEIVQSGAAIGTAYNINRSTDLLNLLMLQNGTQFVDEKIGKAIFDQSSRNSEGKLLATGENALNFYTQFARKGLSQYYTWNPRMHYSIDAFSEGKTAMIFNYSWQVDAISSKAPKLNFSVSPVPQLPNRPNVNYANYWGFTVATNKIAQTSDLGSGQNAPQISNQTRISEAWKLLVYMTSRPDQNIAITANVAGTSKVVDPDFDPAVNYLKKTKKPAARRDIIEAQKTDPVIGVFAEQNLIAKSWKQSDPESTEGIFAEMIDKVNRGASNAQEAVKEAAAKVTSLMGR